MPQRKRPEAEKIRENFFPLFYFNFQDTAKNNNNSNNNNKMKEH